MSFRSPWEQKIVFSNGDIDDDDANDFDDSFGKKSSSRKKKDESLGLRLLKDVINDGGEMPKLIAFDLDYTLWPLWVDTHVSPPIKRKNNNDINLVHDRYGHSFSLFQDVPSILLRLRGYNNTNSKNENVIKDKDADSTNGDIDDEGETRISSTSSSNNNSSGRPILAVCSRTSAPQTAKQVLRSLLLPLPLPGSESFSPTPTTTDLSSPSSSSSTNHKKKKKNENKKDIDGGKIPLNNQGGKENEEKGKTISAIELFDEFEIYPGSKINHFKSLNRKTGIDYSEMLFFDDERRNSEVFSKLGVNFVLVDEDEGVTEEVFRRGVEEWRRRNRKRGGGKE